MLKSEKITNVFLVCLSALLVASSFFSLSFLKVPFGTMMPFSLIPLFLGVERLTTSSYNFSTKKFIQSSFIYFWIFGFIVQFISFFWILKPIIFFGAVPLFIAYPLFLVITIISSTFFPILFSPFALYLYIKCKNKNIKLYLFPVAASITLFEIVLPRFFNWSFGGLLSSDVVFNQLESLFGFNTGSFFIFYVSLLIAKQFLYFNNIKTNQSIFSKLKSYEYFFTAFCVVLVVTLFGLFRVFYVENDLRNSQKFRVGYVQPNFTFNFLASLPLPSKDSQIQSYERMIEMSSQLVKKSIDYDGKNLDLIVWPESTTPDLFLFSQKQISTLTNFSEKSFVPFLIQTIEAKPEDIIKFGFYNAPIWSASVIVNNQGVLPQTFQKWIPMPFGEEFPLEKYFPRLGVWYRSIFKNASKIERGSRVQALPLQNGNVFVTPLICFDTIEQKLSYLTTKYGKSSFFVNQANFVWMVNSNAGLELALLNQMRAIENARSVVVASNTGPSLAFDPLGRLILKPSQLLTQDLNFVDIPLYTGKTLFQIVYKWPLIIVGFFSLCHLVYSSRRKVAQEV
jgi:apolipoprotein N-acyltransferase